MLEGLIMYVWGLWSLHYTQTSAEKAMKLTGKDGFVGRLPVKD